MIVLLGFRYHQIMAELTKIKKRIDELLDKYNEATDPKDKHFLKDRLEAQRQKLEGWYTEHGKG